MNKRKQSNESVQVFIRCRPLVKSESNLAITVEIYPEVNKIFVRDTTAEKFTVKSFTFDKVFGPETKQADIYAEAVSPVVEEVILGFNCTILAYGQTGTGKTFTIEGGRSLNLEDRSTDPLSGIIPRSMNHLFNELSGQYVDFKIHVSFLELYNEEIYDLLSKTEDSVKLKMFDNSSKKGSVIVQDLQIVRVTSMREVYAILDKGCRKRRKAATLLNKASSRSHTIFTVTVYVEESSSTLQKVKTGKLNLVDLAGSENIGRSGAIDKQAREAGSINQSLLALGRVISSLCEKSGHVPYRESKLTRLLQDSLGGQTKTTVIATISPSIIHTEETLKTLEYALRTKSITNKPELNTHVTANALMQEYLDKITELRNNIYEIGSKQGFYMDEESLRQQEANVNSLREEKFEMLSEIERLVEENESLDAAIDDASNKLTEKKSKLENIKLLNENYRVQLDNAKTDYKLHEEMLEIMQPMYDCVHEELHKQNDEVRTLGSEVAKVREKLKGAMQEHASMQNKLQEMRQNRRVWREAFHHNSDNLLKSMKTMNESVNLITLECSNSVNMLKSELEVRTADCEKEFRNLEKTLNQAIDTSLQEGICDSLLEEKSCRLKSIEELQEACSVSNDNSALDGITKVIDDCESNLHSISSSLDEWRKDLFLQINARQNLMMEHMDNQKNSLEATSDSVKDLLNKYKENFEAFNKIISESLNSKTAKRKLWNDKFSAIEQALLSLDVFCTEEIDSEVDKTNQVSSSWKNSSKISAEMAETLVNYCESSFKSIDGIKKEVDSCAHNIFSEKWEDVKTKVNLSSSTYKDLNSELSKFPDTSKNFCSLNSVIEDVEKLNESKVYEVSPCIQMITDTTLKFKTLLAEIQKIADSSSKHKVHAEKLTESPNELSDVLNSNITRYLQCLKTDLLKSLTEGSKINYNINGAEGNSVECSEIDMDETIKSSECLNEASGGNECPACTGKLIDATIFADVSVVVPFPKPHLKTPVKELENGASGSEIKSSVSVPSWSPIRRPRSTNSSPARKNLQFPNIEELTIELLEKSSDEEQP